jgi:hypothetical protein
VHGQEALLWGLFGGAAIESLDFCQFARSAKRRKQARKLPTLEIVIIALSVIVRVCVGGGLALAAQRDGQIVGAMGAVGIGVAAPLVLAQFFKLIPGEPPSALETVPEVPPISRSVTLPVHQPAPAVPEQLDPNKPQRWGSQ